MSRERDVIKVQVWRLVLLWVVMLGLFLSLIHIC